ncbi:MAG TPA: hypothetical protein VMF06_08410 [Candidatus Limnocylindria bacterium]|jgi:hypothetical protein|nr:hypothetical protein [Candidatus Limnocylindria bacterium]
MKRLLCIFSTVAALVMAGCKGESDEEKAAVGMPNDPLKHADEVSAKLKSTFANDQTASTPIDEVTQALKKNDLEGAAMGVAVMQRVAPPNRTFEQSQVLNKLMLELQANIANGVANGDPAALKAAEALRANASGAGQ